MSDSQNSTNEKFTDDHKKILASCTNDKDKVLLFEIFSLIDDHLVDQPKFIALLQALKKYQYPKLIENITNRSWFFAELSLSEDEFCNALRFMESRHLKQQLESKLGGRPRRINLILIDLARYPPFTKDFYAICNTIRANFHYSTIMKALRLFCHNL
jgi:hypothetical protein